MLNLLNPLWLINNWITCYWVGAAVSVGGAIGGGLFGDDSAEDAADEQAQASAEAIAELRKIGDRTRSDTSPYRGLGSASANRLNQLLGLTDFSRAGTFGKGDLVVVDDQGNFQMNDELAYDPNYQSAFNRWKEAHQQQYNTSANLAKGSLEYGAEDTIYSFLGADGLQGINDESLRRAEAAKADPMYGSLLRSFTLADLNADVVYNKGLEFGKNEGLKALERRQLALGGFDSGSAVKAATRFANDYGETKAAGAQQRFMGDKAFTLNSLLGTTNVGQRAVETDANTGMQMATAIGGAQMGAGNARAAGIVGGANAWGNAIGGIGSAINNYRDNETLKSVLGGSGGYAGNYGNAPGIRLPNF